MLCRTCGNPVKVRDDRWECPYCYDYGRIKRSEVPILLTWKFSCRMNLSGIWRDLKTALAALSPDGTLEPLLGKVLLHEISAALRQLNAPPSAQKIQELEHFLNHTPDLHLEDRPRTILQYIPAFVLYAQEAKLTEQFLGRFWAQLLADLTPEQYFDGIPEPLSDLQRELACVWSYFSSTDVNDIGDPLPRQHALEDAFQLHWQKKALLSPDAERAKVLLSHGKFSPSEDICRNILVTEFPEAASVYTLDELDDQHWYDLLDDVVGRDTAKAIQMWRTLLDIAAPCLPTNSTAAEQLLRDWDALESSTLYYIAEPFLDALEDDTFAKQIFQSAHVGHLQRQLLELCRKYDRSELGRHCLELVLENPYTSEHWQRRLKQTLSPAEKRDPTPPAEPLPDDGTVFHYCTVQLEGIRRPYAYLTGGLPLQVGDQVEVPFGADDNPRRGRVCSVTDCTRTSAPWPPEQTKAVLRMDDTH